MIDAEVGHDGDVFPGEDQAELEALENAERVQGADFIDDNIIEAEQIENYNSTELFGSDSDDQEELAQLALAQRPDYMQHGYLYHSHEHYSS